MLKNIFLIAFEVIFIIRQLSFANKTSMKLNMVNLRYVSPQIDTVIAEI